MARFTFKMPAQWLRWCTRCAESERPFRTMHLDADPERLLGPGWFDSSWDLEQGLLVREGPPSDTRLLEWLDACVARHALAEAARLPALSPACAPITARGVLEFDTGGLELVA